VIASGASDGYSRDEGQIGLNAGEAQRWRFGPVGLRSSAQPTSLRAPRIRQANVGGSRLMGFVLLPNLRALRIPRG